MYIMHFYGRPLGRSYAMTSGQVLRHDPWAGLTPAVAVALTRLPCGPHQTAMLPSPGCHSLLLYLAFLLHSLYHDFTFTLMFIIHMLFDNNQQRLSLFFSQYKAQ